MYRTLLAALAMTVTLPATTRAQEWTAAEREVWQALEACAALQVQEDLEGLMRCFHDDFLGWHNAHSVPTNKADRKAGMLRTFETSEAVWSYAKPLGIRVHGDMAVVHYLWFSVYKDASGEENNISGRCTDVLVKQGNRWVALADAGCGVAET